jgi:hypothetical protein
MTINIAFCRNMLQAICCEVRRKFPGTKVSEAWVWTDRRRRHWEFHFQGKLIWDGRADNAYDARYKGWMAFIDKYEQYSEVVGGEK